MLRLLNKRLQLICRGRRKLEAVDLLLLALQCAVVGVGVSVVFLLARVNPEHPSPTAPLSAATAIVDLGVVCGGRSTGASLPDSAGSPFLCLDGRGRCLWR